MFKRNLKNGMFTIGIAIIAFMLSGSATALAHCDTMDGPIIKSAQEALETGKSELVLMWIQKKDEPELMQAFQKAREVRKLNPAARDLADRYFLETFVRLHRAGEGAPYTGIKPAGTEVDPSVKQADKALETGSPEELLKFMSSAVVKGVREQYERASELRKHAGHSVEAGRDYAAAYVTYVHYVERLYNMAMPKGAHGGHEPPATKHAH
ncbi:MAG TPA: DUF6448 family protein [Geobacteraceae bacterium]|nr:DUF6448 family protein [Geobacteraceae bacterium]